MIGWLLKGLRSRRLTSAYPRRAEQPPAAFRGRAILRSGEIDEERAQAIASVCLPGALSAEGAALRLDAARCIGCGLCELMDPDVSVELEPRYELASRERERLVAASGDIEAGQNGFDRRIRMLPRPFRRSIHIRHVDTGSDGAVEQEIAALVNPYYDMQRLGFFFTATPRHADVLLVTGPVTTSMEEYLRRTYEAMPDPRIVLAAGTDACSGGVWSGPDVLGGVDKVLPVDVYVPGDPPSPISLLHGLLLASGRAVPAPSPVKERAV
jgi:Ni,Fe-hydrogenase III small subunit/formate hydrogenlyase subunit 6/NADH:ubiquinone oxidoreductase subunit I